MRNLKLPISAIPANTLKVWAAELRKPMFVVKDDLRYAPYSPPLSANGTMTVTAQKVLLGEYRILGDDVDFYLTMSFTTGGTAASDIRFPLPVTAALSDTVGKVAFACWALDGTQVSGHANIESESYGVIRRYDSASWGLGTGRQFGIRGSYRAF